MTEPSFLWHDFETFGTDPRRDRPCQFAAVRTDRDLEPVAEPEVWYCRPTYDVLPAPEACLVTGITPQLAERRGLAEYEFAARIHELMSQPGTCAVGYNNFRFDDEVTRFLFWRNFIDPYAREFRNGNSRFDLIDVLRMACALRPDGIRWHYDADGVPGFRLEMLARENGLDTDDAHDALADVRNTLAMARLLRRHHPRLWAWALGLRRRHVVEGLVEKREMLLHASSRFPAAGFCIAPVLPLFRHPAIRSQWLVWNLREDPADFESLDAGLLADLHWTASADLPDGYRRLPVKWIRTNRCPMLSPMGTLDEASAERTGIDVGAAERHARRLRATDDFVQRLQALFGQPRAGVASDAETALYDGFVGDADRRVAERIRAGGPGAAAELLEADPGPFGDERLAELLLHFVGRHAEERLGPEHLRAWRDYRRRRLVDDPDIASIQLADYHARIEQLRRERPDAGRLLDQLAEWPARIGADAEIEGR